MASCVALPRKFRLSSKKDIDRVFKNGRTVRGSFLFIRFLSGREEKSSRFALIIPAKHVSLAVDRSKIKRIFSEEIKNPSLLLEHGYDVIIVIHTKIERGRFKKVTEELRKLLNVIRQLNN